MPSRYSCEVRRTITASSSHLTSRAIHAHFYVSTTASVRARCIPTAPAQHASQLKPSLVHQTLRRVRGPRVDDHAQAAQVGRTYFDRHVVDCQVYRGWALRPCRILFPLPLSGFDAEAARVACT